MPPKEKSGVRKTADKKEKLIEYLQKAGIEVNDFLYCLFEDHVKQLAEDKKKEDVNVSDSTKDLPARLEVSGKRLKEEKQKHEIDLKATDAEINYKEYIRTLQRENEEINNELQQLQKSTEQSDKIYKEDIKNLQREKEELTNELQQLQKSTEEKEIIYQEDIRYLQRKKKKLNNELQQLQKSTEQKDKEHRTKIEKLEETIQEMKQQHEKQKDETNRLQRLNKEMDRRQKESEKLSKVFGAKVMDDNPNITDLSDENRPTKLAEQHSELYDNQWTDAFEEAENSNAGEKKTVRELYDLLVRMYTFCQELAAKHATSIQNAVLALSGSDTKETIDKLGVTKVGLLKELRKSIAPHLVDQVFQLFVKEKNFNGKPKMKIFAKECCKLCWLMASQDPPIVLDTTEVKGAFDGDRFREYTKSGKAVDYVVWPPLLLHKGGPLLCKGVAQGK